MSTKPPRITIKELISYVLDLINFEKGIPFAMKELLLRPKRSLDIYFNEDRHYLVNPLRFLVFGASLLLVLMLADKDSFMYSPLNRAQEDISALSSNNTLDSLNMGVATKPFQTGEKIGKQVKKGNNKNESDSITIGNVDVDSLNLNSPTSQLKGNLSEKQQQRLKLLFESLSDVLKKYINLISFLTIPIMGWFSWIMFREHTYNYAEHLVLISFMMAWTTWATIPFAILDSLLKIKFSFSMIISIPLIFGFMYHFYKRIFKESVGASILKIFVLYIVQQTALAVLLVAGLFIVYGINLLGAG